MTEKDLLRKLVEFYLSVPVESTAAFLERDGSIRLTCACSTADDAVQFRTLHLPHSFPFAPCIPGELAPGTAFNLLAPYLLREMWERGDGTRFDPYAENSTLRELPL
jgi:hypothetical protein